MATIKIIEKEDGYAYKYEIIGEDKKKRYVTKSGFKTPNEALEAGKKSYYRRTQPVKKPDNSPTIHVKNIDITDKGYMLLTAAVTGAVVLTVVAGGIKLVKTLREKFPPIPERHIEDVIPLTRFQITPVDCDTSNLHIILRTANLNTEGVVSVTADMLTRLGISNEIVSGDSNLSSRVSNAITANPNSNIVLINIETGLENSNNGRVSIMGDASNSREYPSDILATCIRASLREYSFNPVILSGQHRGGDWRIASYIEEELKNSGLINNISQLTINVPEEVGEDNIIRNDISASLLEGIMRWTTLDVTERYRDIYYTTGYGETSQTVGERFGISSLLIEENSDINIHTGVTVGDALLVGTIPSVAEENVTVSNPYTTTDIDSIVPVTTQYVVQSGDTITRIANMFGVEPETIITASGDPNNIAIGETLYITTYNLYETHEKINPLDEEINHQ